MISHFKYVISAFPGSFLNILRLIHKLSIRPPLVVHCIEVCAPDFLFLPRERQNIRRQTIQYWTLGTCYGVESGQLSVYLLQKLFSWTCVLFVCELMPFECFFRWCEVFDSFQFHVQLSLCFSFLIIFRMSIVILSAEIIFGWFVVELCLFHRSALTNLQFGVLLVIQRFYIVCSLWTLVLIKLNSRITC